MLDPVTRPAPWRVVPRPAWRVAAAGAVLVLAGCAGTHTGSGHPGAGASGSAGTGGGAASTGTGAGAPALPAPGARAGLEALDPDHGLVQPFPPSGSCRARTVPAGVLPDPRCTPGAVDPHVTQANLAATICRRGGYTSTVRPPVGVTDTEKHQAMSAYADTSPVTGYELDHLVPLSIGGTPNAAANLWPEPGHSPNTKDKLEARLHAQVCDHQLPLAQAQQMIASNWVTAYHQVLGTAPAP